MLTLGSCGLQVLKASWSLQYHEALMTPLQGIQHREVTTHNSLTHSNLLNNFKKKIEIPLE